MISRGALVGSRAITPGKYLLSHIFHETWWTCRAIFRHYQLFPEMEETLIEKVCQQTFLYDTKSPDYRDKHMRPNAWEGMGKELETKRKFYVSSRDVMIMCPRLNSCRLPDLEDRHTTIFQNVQNCMPKHNIWNHKTCIFSWPHFGEKER